MGGFLSVLKRAGKGIGRAGKAFGRYEKQRYGLGGPASSGDSAAGSDPVADAVKADRKKGRAKQRD